MTSGRKSFPSPPNAKFSSLVAEMISEPPSPDVFKEKEEGPGRGRGHARDVFTTLSESYANCRPLICRGREDVKQGCSPSPLAISHLTSKAAHLQGGGGGGGVGVCNAQDSNTRRGELHVGGRPCFLALAVVPVIGFTPANILLFAHLPPLSAGGVLPHLDGHRANDRWNVFRRSSCRPPSHSKSCLECLETALSPPARRPICSRTLSLSLSRSLSHGFVRLAHLLSRPAQQYEESRIPTRSSMWRLASWSPSLRPLCVSHVRQELDVFVAAAVAAAGDGADPLSVSLARCVLQCPGGRRARPARTNISLLVVSTSPN